MEEKCNNPNVLKFIVGNKADVEKAQRKVSLKEGKEFADQRGFEFFEVTAKEDKGEINGMFKEIIEQIRIKYPAEKLSGSYNFSNE